MTGRCCICKQEAVLYELNGEYYCKKCFGDEVNRLFDETVHKRINRLKKDMVNH